MNKLRITIFLLCSLFLLLISACDSDSTIEVEKVDFYIDGNQDIIDANEITSADGLPAEGHPTQSISASVGVPVKFEAVVEPLNSKKTIEWDFDSDGKIDSREFSADFEYSDEKWYKAKLVVNGDKVLEKWISVEERIFAEKIPEPEIVVEEKIESDQEENYEEVEKVISEPIVYEDPPKIETEDQELTEKGVSEIISKPQITEEPKSNKFNEEFNQGIAIYNAGNYQNALSFFKSLLNKSTNNEQSSKIQEYLSKSNKKINELEELKIKKAITGSYNKAIDEFNKKEYKLAKSSFQAFISKFPDSEYASKAEAQILLCSKKIKELEIAEKEKTAYLEAGRLASIGSWEQFLKKYPNGKYSIAANEYLDKLKNKKLACDKALSSDNKDVLKSYLTKYQNEECARAVSQRLDVIRKKEDSQKYERELQSAFDNLMQNRSIDGCQNFLNEYGSSKYASEVENLKERLIKDKDKAAALAAEKEIKRKIDTRYQDVIRRKDERELERFIVDFRNDSYAQENYIIEVEKELDKLKKPEPKIVEHGTGSVGVAHSNNSQTCLSYSSGGTISLTPKIDMDLLEAKVYASNSGYLEIVLSGSSLNESTEVALVGDGNNESSQCSLQELYASLKAGNTYQLKFVPQASGSVTPKLRNVADCIKSGSVVNNRSDKLEINYNGNYFMVDLKFKY